MQDLIFTQLLTQFIAITIPPRNYTGYTLATALVKLFNAAAANFSPVVWNFTCTYDQGVNTLTITGNLNEGKERYTQWQVLQR